MTPLEPPQSDAPLWICHRCELIGLEIDARRHSAARGHRIERLSGLEAAEIRAIWQEEGRSLVDGDERV
jgi:hypothetical protein